jgi:hypothetical protein
MSWIVVKAIISRHENLAFRMISDTLETDGVQTYGAPADAELGSRPASRTLSRSG